MSREKNSKKRWVNDLKDKQFFPRESLLTDLRKVNNLRTAHNMFVAGFVTLLFTSAVRDYMETKSINLGLRTLKNGFQNFPFAFKIWMVMQSSSIIFFVVYRSWAARRYELLSKTSSVWALDAIFLVAYIMYQGALAVVPAKFILDEYIAPLSTVLLTIEQLRIMMKTHAFVRSTAARMLTNDTGDEKGGKVYYPKFAKFAYFMFAPVLVYKDEYPRNTKIRWSFVAWYFLEIVMCVMYTAFLFERFVFMRFEELRDQMFQPKALILGICDTLLPSILIFLVTFHLLFHSWHNFFAELLRFADRLFYKDWWNSSNFDALFGAWNMIVHDWFYVYVYKDVYGKLHNKQFARFIVFLFSAVMHEYVYSMSFRYLYPIMFISFIFIGLQMTLSPGKRADSDLSMWFVYIVSVDLISSLYAMEFYARLYCSTKSYHKYHTFMPRSWICFLESNDTLWM
ncbi:hypothetical protein QAD02_003825 [Eretmocerus hayati]|uniref:Uncharacterized protein n=1 Tax=Eretmocerus hayati TaxID=131215 RepID=A0ACC2NPM9_9HYME|nr:hypothetical protein QAD02_003825 [Eretmocerus hayati]